MIYRFEGFELDEERFELRQGLQPLALPRKSFEVLKLLLRRAGSVVSKQEIFAEVWPGEYVSEPVLPVHMHTIRKVLGEPASGSIIRTVRGRGYSINCPVESAQIRRSPAQPQLPAGEALVGREALLEELQTEYWSAAAGHGRALLLYGEAGIGKTRVLERLGRWAQQQGAIVLQGRGEADPGAPPFWVLLELLRSGSHVLEAEPLRSKIKETGFDLEASRTDVRALFAAGTDRGLDPDSVRFRLSLTLIELADKVSQIAPLVLLVDDVHAVDEGSLRLWSAAVRQIRERRVLMVAAYREGEVPRDSRLAVALGSLATESAVREIPLRNLEADAVEQLVRIETGYPPPSDFVRSLCECTEGNPFFLRELLRLLTSEGRLSPESGRWDLSQITLPRASREAIERRLATVSPECHELLIWAAVIGRRFSFPLLERAADLPSPTVLELLREAAEARLIATQTATAGPGDLPLGEYCFTHALFREAIYSRLSGPERVLRHRAVGHAVEQLQAQEGSKDLPELAHHFFQAAPGGDIDRATQYCVRAARRALWIFAYDDAVRHFEHALRAEELRATPDALNLCCVTLALADALRRAGRYDEAKAMFLQTAQRARDLGREDLLAYAALGLAKWPRFVGPKLPFRAGRPPNHAQRKEVMELVDEALRALDEGTHPSYSRLRVRLLSVQARAEEDRGHRGSATNLAERAVSLARREQDPRALLDALLARRMALRMPQDSRRGLEVASELVTIAEKLGAPPLLFVAYEARIPALLGQGEMDAVDRDLAAANEIAERLRTAEHQYTVARLQLCRALSGGRLVEVPAALERYRDLGARACDRDVGQKWLLLRLGQYWLEGRSALSRPQMEALAEQGQVRSAADYSFHADFWRAVGDMERCAEYFSQAAAEGFQNVEVNDDWLWTLCLCAQCCADLGDTRRARQLYELIAPYAGLNVTGSLGTYRGSARFELARLALVLGEPRVARNHFEAAMAFNRRIGARTAYLLTKAHYGRALMRGAPEDRARGKEMAQEVERTADELGLVLLRRASDLSARI